jgi:hypothetical protein
VLYQSERPAAALGYPGRFNRLQREPLGKFAERPDAIREVGLSEAQKAGQIHKNRSSESRTIRTES